MKSKLLIIILAEFLLLIAFLLSSCSNNSRKEKADNNSEIENLEKGFVADPQFVEERPIAKLAIGEKAPDFNLPGIDGDFHKLSDYAESEVLVVNFTCNHCPTAQAYEDRFIQTANDYKGKSVAFVEIVRLRRHCSDKTRLSPYYRRIRAIN